MDRLSNKLLKPMGFPAFPRLDEINDFFKGLSVGILKNGTYLPCQIIGAITKNSDICDFPKTLEATDVNNECIYRAGILTADVASMISGVIMTVLGISSIIGGSVTSVGGIAVTGTGVGALVGIPTIVVSSGVVVSGVVQSVSGVSLVYSSVKSFSGDLDEFNKATKGVKNNTESGEIPDYVKDDRVPLDKETVLTNKEYKKTKFKIKGAQVYKKGEQYYYRDTFHKGKAAHLEVFNKRGIHIGEADPLTGNIIPNTADPSKIINLK